jgi:hypothetical protein
MRAVTISHCTKNAKRDWTDYPISLQLKGMIGTYSFMEIFGFYNVILKGKAGSYDKARRRGSYAEMFRNRWIAAKDWAPSAY